MFSRLKPTMPQPSDSNPYAEYQRRLQQRFAARNRWQHLDERLSLARGLVFLAAVAFTVPSLTVLPGLWILVALLGLVFFALVVWHPRVVRKLQKGRTAVSYYERGLDRLRNRWPGHGPTGERYADSLHLFADDLDLFGRASLFQYVCRARTRLGEDRLAEWLLHAAARETIHRRQAAVAELSENLDLRERLALLDAEVHDELDQNLLRNWSAQRPQPVDWRIRLTAVLFSAVTLGAIAVWFTGLLQTAWLLLALTAMGLFQFSLGRRIRTSAAAAETAESGLLILSQVLELIEQAEFQHPSLKAMQAQLQTEHRPPSRHIHRLDSLIRALNNSLRNQFFALFGFLLALPVHLTHAVETWRGVVGRHIPEWLDAVAEWEALMSLSGYAYENPTAAMPEIVEDGPLFDAVQLGHPLLPDENCVRNDVRLDESQRLILVSGSNMSGKSTLLRAVGVNAVLALAGGPVRAGRLRLSPLQVASSMRVQDSLQDGRSLFFAALQRIKAIVDAAEHSRLPVLFMLDEILQGTNSHDRRIGAEHVIHTLLKRGGIGLVTTHDLALTEIAHQLPGQAVNTHFQDELADGRMTFDYRLRPGVVEKSNALELMRSLGLDVPALPR